MVFNSRTRLFLQILMALGLVAGISVLLAVTEPGRKVAGYVLNTINSVDGATWGALIEIIVSAVTVSAVMVGVKKWFKVTSEKYMVTFVILGSMLAAAFSYLVSVPELSPWVITIKGWLTFGATQPVFFLFIKPLFKRLATWFSEQVAKAALANEAQSAAVPAEGLPLTSVTPQNISDFSQ